MRRQDFIPLIVRIFKFTSYLEIGCGNDLVFSEINIHKVGVDPNSGGTLRMTSDEFFSQNTEKFDLIFIDGLHEANQVLKDIQNSVNCLNDGGLILVHDCSPVSEENQLVPHNNKPDVRWNGDVWKAFVLTRKRSDLDCAVGNFEHGLGCIKVRPNSSKLEINESEVSQLQWKPFETNRSEYLRLMAYEDFLRWIEFE